ncbi:MAG TPA: acyltransferase [Gemmatales bacterium]|nr:acyltransferase [Gemmatales bacterium]
MSKIEATSMTASPPMTEKSNEGKVFEIPSLDGIRAIAFMIVFMSHTRLNGVFPGGFGVTIFFFLSGYLITTLLRREYERHGRISIPKFYLRRTLRIFPPLYATIILASLLVAFHVAPDHYYPGAICSNCLFFTNYYMIADHDAVGYLLPGTGSLWSLAVEEHFYLMFPLLFVVLLKFVRSSKWQMVILAFLWLAISAWRCWLVYGEGMAVINYQRLSLATDTRLDSILIGCILAIYGNPMYGNGLRSPTIWKWLLGFSVVILLWSISWRNVELRESIRYSVQNLALIPVFYCAIRFPEWLVFRWLQWRAVRFVGVLSYSLYLTHQPIITTFHHLTSNPWIIEMGALLVTFFISWLFYLGIEKPSARLRTKLLEGNIRKSNALP